MNVSDVLNITYRIVCYIGTFCSIFLLCEKYFTNEDSSIILSKRFKETTRNSFPAITLCLGSTHFGNLYNDQYLVSNTGLKGKQYSDILMGNIKMPNSSGLDTLNFEMATIKLQNYLISISVKDKSNNHLIQWKQESFKEGANVSQNLPFGVYYQDPTLICNSYHTDVATNINLGWINLVFSIAKLQSIKGGQLYIYAHKKNHLFRHMSYQYKIRSFNGISYNNVNNYLIVELNSISILRSRKDANKPCIEDLSDDYEWMQQVVKLIGCFPPYWRRMYLGLTNFNECNTTEALKNMSTHLPYVNSGMSSLVLKMYNEPCEQMRVLSSSNNDEYSKKRLLKLKIRFRYSQNIDRFRLS